LRAPKIKQVISVARTCGLILIVLDAGNLLTHKFKIEYELEGFGIRLNKSPPDIILKKIDKGVISITKSVPQTQMTDETIKSILHEYKLGSYDVQFRCDATVDKLIDVAFGNRIYVPCIYVLNKIDSISVEELDFLDQVPNYMCISAKDKWNLDELIE
jgi:ribosome-interacting GTPase 1